MAHIKRKMEKNEGKIKTKIKYFQTYKNSKSIFITSIILVEVFQAGEKMIPDVNMDPCKGIKRSCR